MNNFVYVLITPARNEEAFIDFTLQSMVRQTTLPARWVIVNDGSTDGTSDKVRPYLSDHPWIKLIELPRRKERHFAAKVNAFNIGREAVKDIDYAFICNLDSDVSLDPDHFEFLLNEFAKDPGLGVAGTVFREHDGYNSAEHSFEGQNHVSGQCQLFRRECYEEIGGYKPNKAGGIDWMAVIHARMIGWRTRSFREKSFFHHRKLGTAERGQIASSFAYGVKDYHMGGHPVWEMFRVARRMTKSPYIVGGAALGLGFLSAIIRRPERPVSNELMAFHRKEQMEKLRGILTSVISFKRVDPFQTTK